MLGHETREATIEESNTVGTCDWGQHHARRLRREACPGAARGTNAAHRSSMRGDSAAIAGIIVMAIAVLVHMLSGYGSTAMVRLAQHHQFACIAAQRQRSEQQDEHQQSGKALHGGDPIIGIVSTDRDAALQFPW